jgi:histidinol phosphatase-like enzyme
MVVLIGIDRDGTINKDEDYFLGSSPDWKGQVKLLPGVIEGIRMLKSLKDIYVFIVTNQAGVAL